MWFTLLTNSSPRPGPTTRSKQLRQALAGAFDPGRDDPGRNHGRFEQAQVVLGEIEYLGQVRDVRGRTEINAGQAQAGFLDHAQVGFHRRAWIGVAPMHAEVDRHIEDFGSLGKVHAQKEDVAPAAMREVHADGRGFPQNRVGAVRRVTPKQLRPQAQRLIRGVSHAEHPLVAANGAHAAADLVGKGLERQPVVSCRQGAGDGIVGSGRPHGGQEMLDSFLEPPLEQVLKPMKWNFRGLSIAARRFQQRRRQMKTMDRVKKEQSANAFVEIATLSPERIERRALSQKLGCRQSRAGAFQRAIADFRAGRRDDLNQVGHIT